MGRKKKQEIIETLKPKTKTVTRIANDEEVKDFNDRRQLAKRDPEGQRLQVYERYVAGKHYEPLGDGELEEAISTVLCVQSSRGIIALPKFVSGAELQGAIDAYWVFLRDAVQSGRQIIPDVEGLASFIGVSRSTISEWRKGNPNKEFSPIVERAMNDIAMVKKQLAMKNKIPALIYLNDMQNNHGYLSNNSKVDIDITARR